MIYACLFLLAATIGIMFGHIHMHDKRHVAMGKLQTLQDLRFNYVEARLHVIELLFLLENPEEEHPQRIAMDLVTAIRTATEADHELHTFIKNSLNQAKEEKHGNADQSRD
jgi:hypothetical protein